MMSGRQLFQILLFISCSAGARPREKWPVLKHYDKDHLLNIALPMGGIGTGTVSLGGRGELRKISRDSTGDDIPVALARSGFCYSGIARSLTFISRPGTYFWSNGSSWETCKVEPGRATLQVLSGQLTLSEFTLQGRKTKKLDGLSIKEQETKTIVIP